MENKEKDLNLEKLKLKFKILQEKYELPDFDSLNQLFDIEDIDNETDFLLRRIRRVISDRIGAYARFVEVILNPSGNAPVFFFNVLKKLDSNDMEKIKSIYETLGNLEISILLLDLDYSENNEADFIKKVFNILNEDIRLRFLEVIRKMSDNNNNIKKDNNRSYFG